MVGIKNITTYCSESNKRNTCPCLVEETLYFINKYDIISFNIKMKCKEC